MDSEFSRKKALVFGVLLLVFLAIPVTVYTALQEQTVSSKASKASENDVVVVISGEQITKAQIRAVAEEQYAPKSVDQLALQDALEILAERKILDKAAKDYKLTLDQARVDRFKKEEFSEVSSKYEALRQQVTLAAVNSREAYAISYWNPPYDGINTLTVEEQADAAIQLSKGIPALNSIEEKILAGNNLNLISQSILTEYPELLTVLSMNGYIYSILDDKGKVLASYPLIYEFGNSGLDDEVRDSLFAQSEGAVIKISDTESNRGGYVFKIKKKGNTNGARTYEEWLSGQKTNSVKVIEEL